MPFSGPESLSHNDAPEPPKVEYTVSELPDGIEQIIEGLCAKMFEYPGYKDQYGTQIQHIVDQLQGNPAQAAVQKYLNEMYEYGVANVKYLSGRSG